MENKIIYRVNEGLTEIKIPKGTKKVFLDGNNLTKLPKLPEGLTHLHVQNNKLTELPYLPKSLEVLDVDNNELTDVPRLHLNLHTLSCRNNNMTDISFSSFEKNNNDGEVDIGDCVTLTEFLKDNFC